MKLSIFGAGYVGLVTGACLADVGHKVLCIDTDPAKVALLQQGQIPIHEPGLKAIVVRNLNKGRLSFSTDAAAAALHGQICLIAVGTPPGEDGSADLQYVLAVARSIAQQMQGYQLIVNKSTVPVGTADRVREQISAVLRERGASVEFDVISNPEFLKEGSAVADFQKPDRIIVGTESARARALMTELYKPFNRSHQRTMFMDVRSAELTKYASNAMLAARISFMNELANMAERLGADIEEVRRGMGADPRIGYQFIYPGCGYGGSCFPKDVRALERLAHEVGYEAPLLASIETVNQRQKLRLFDKLVQALGGAQALRGQTLALWGLAFKPNTDDMREAPSRTLMEALWRAGAQVRAYDPVAMAETRKLYGQRPDLILADDKYAALEGATALLICTEWQQFRAPDFEEMASRMRQRLIIDGRNLYSPDNLREMDWTYLSIGRTSISRQTPKLTPAEDPVTMVPKVQLQSLAPGVAQLSETFHDEPMQQISFALGARAVDCPLSG
jgi:UDPglucose 6-dehydrogenase